MVATQTVLQRLKPLDFGQILSWLKPRPTRIPSPQSRKADSSLRPAAARIRRERKSAELRAGWQALFRRRQWVARYRWRT